MDRSRPLVSPATNPAASRTKKRATREIEAIASSTLVNGETVKVAEQTEVKDFIDFIYKDYAHRQTSATTSSLAISKMETDADSDLIMKVWSCVWCGTKTTTFHVLDESGHNPAKPCDKNIFTSKHEPSKYNVIELVPISSLVDCSALLQSKCVAQYRTLEDLIAKPILIGIGERGQKTAGCLIASSYCESLYHYGWRADLPWVEESRKFAHIPASYDQLMATLRYKKQRGDGDGEYFAPALASRCEQRSAIALPFLPFAVLSRTNEYKRFV